MLMMSANALLESETNGVATSGKALDSSMPSPLGVDTGREISYRTANIVSHCKPILCSGAPVGVLARTRRVVLGQEVSEVNKSRDPLFK